MNPFADTSQPMHTKKQRRLYAIPSRGGQIKIGLIQFTSIKSVDSSVLNKDVGILYKRCVIEIATRVFAYFSRNGIWVGASQHPKVMHLERE